MESVSISSLVGSVGPIQEDMTLEDASRESRRIQANEGLEPLEIHHAEDTI